MAARPRTGVDPLPRRAASVHRDEPGMDLVLAGPESPLASVPRPAGRTTRRRTTRRGRTRPHRHLLGMTPSRLRTTITFILFRTACRGRDRREPTTTETRQMNGPPEPGHQSSESAGQTWSRRVGVRTDDRVHYEPVVADGVDAHDLVVDGELHRVGDDGDLDVLAGPGPTGPIGRSREADRPAVVRDAGDGHARGRLAGPVAAGWCWFGLGGLRVGVVARGWQPRPRREGSRRARCDTPPRPVRRRRWPRPDRRTRPG